MGGRGERGGKGVVLEEGLGVVEGAWGILGGNGAEGREG